jgi:hypothetical protein
MMVVLGGSLIDEVDREAFLVRLTECFVGLGGDGTADTLAQVRALTTLLTRASNVLGGEAHG